MASAFGHGILAYTIKKIGAKDAPIKITFLAILCSVIPDADVLAFKFGIPYGHMFGHRGFTHSIFFGIIFGLLVAFIFHRKNQIKFALIYMLACVSHPVLDAMTTGGKGVAFLAPFSDDRFFFPWRFIQVSPMSIRRFFSEWGIEVLVSEFIFIWIPCLLLLALNWGVRKMT